MPCLPRETIPPASPRICVTMKALKCAESAKQIWLPGGADEAPERP